MSFNPLHDQHWPPIWVDPEDMNRNDVRVLEITGDTRLLEQGVRREWITPGARDLHCDFTLKRTLESNPYGAHATLPHRFDDDEAAQSSTGGRWLGHHHLLRLCLG